MRALVDALEARGIVCWISERDIAAGDNYGDSIVDSIEKASAMVLVFSGAANDSDEIKKEVALASQRRITVVPVRIEDAAPSKAFRYELATRNWIDIFPDWDSGVAKLGDRLAAILALPSSERATPSAKPAPAPRRSNAAAYGLGAVVALALVAAVVWFATRPGPVPPTPALTIPPTPNVAQISPPPEPHKSPAAAPTSPATATASPAPTVVATPSPTPTPAASLTPTPAPIATSPATATPSPAPTAVATSSPTPSPAPTATSPAIAAPSPAPTVLVAPSPTPTVAAAPSPTPTVIATSAAVATPTASPTIAATTTVVASPTATASPSPSPIAGATPVPAAKPAAIAIGPPPALAANDPGGEVFKECEECPQMVAVPSGKAMLGSPVGESGRQTNEMTPHEVDIAKPFAVGRYAVTFKEWDACFAEGGCGHRTLGDLDFGRDRRPVIFATWNEAQLYVDWLKRKTGQPYRLLSEAEWEYAARGCTSLKCPYEPFWFGAITPEIAVYNWRTSYQGSPKSSASLKTAPVDSGPPNPFGLYNMLGNVRQWTLDCWSATPASAPSDGAPITAGDCTAHATRGGSWADPPVKLRAAARDWEAGDEGSEKIGFRVARPLAP